MGDEAVEKIEKWLTLWVYHMTTYWKSIADSTAVRLQVKEMYDHVTQGHKNAKLFSASASCPHFKRQDGVKNVKLEVLKIRKLWTIF